jgi:outer membrane lipoprotein-sorting protein
MLKKFLLLSLLVSLSILYGCTQKSTTTLPEDEAELPEAIKSISGFDDVEANSFKAYKLS